jgi:hypothetical protein
MKSHLLTGRVPRFIGVILLVLGAAAVIQSSRVLSTLFLDVVVQILRPPGGEALESYDYFWGTMRWGRSAADFSMVSAGFLLIAIGQLLVLPGTLSRSATKAGGSLPKIAMIVAAGLTILAGACLLLISTTIMQVFGVLATVGSVDPVQFGESLPILATRVFTACLAGAQFFIIVAAFRGGLTSPPAARIQTIIALCAAICLSGFALLTGFIRIFPVALLTDYDAIRATGDPVAVARQVSLALNTMCLAAPLLALSGILLLVASLLTSRTSPVSGTKC